MNIWNQDWETLTIVNNFIFLKTFSRNNYAQYFLEKLLNTKLVKLSTLQKEKLIDEYFRLRSIRLDIFAEEQNGRMFDVEMQTSNKAEDCLPKRAFYQQAMMTVSTYKKGEKPITIRDSYVIFVCTFDPFDCGYAYYPFSYACTLKPSLLMNEGKQIIYLNTKGINNGLDDEIYDLLLYMNGNQPQKKFAKTISEEVLDIKNDSKIKEEYMILSDAIENAWYEGTRVGEQRGEQRGIQYSILSNLSEKFSVDQVNSVSNVLCDIKNIDNLKVLFKYSRSVESPNLFIEKIADLKLKEENLD